MSQSLKEYNRILKVTEKARKRAKEEIDKVFDEIQVEIANEFRHELDIEMAKEFQNKI